MSPPEPVKPTAQTHVQSSALLFLLVFLTGCATSQVGKLTFSQAISDWGQPLSTERVSNGETRATWLSDQKEVAAKLNPNGSVTITPSGDRSWKEFSALTQHDADGTLQAVPRGTPVGSTVKGRIAWYRVLTFRADGVLKNSDERSKVEWKN